MKLITKGFSTRIRKDFPSVITGGFSGRSVIVVPSVVPGAADLITMGFHVRSAKRMYRSIITRGFGGSRVVVPPVPPAVGAMSAVVIKEFHHRMKRGCSG